MFASFNIKIIEQMMDRNNEKWHWSQNKSGSLTYRSSVYGKHNHVLIIIMR